MGETRRFAIAGGLVLLVALLGQPALEQPALGQPAPDQRASDQRALDQRALDQRASDQPVLGDSTLGEEDLTGSGFVQPPELCWQETRVGDGDLTTLSLPTAVPAALVLRLPFPVEVRCGSSADAAGITAVLDANLLTLLAVEERDGVLDLHMTAACRSDQPARLTVTMPRLQRLRTYGAAPVTVTGLDGGTLRHRHYGTGAVALSGVLDRYELALYSSGDLDGRRLAVRTARVEILGAGDARVAVAESLDVALYGAGDVVTYGRTRHVERDRFGRGRLVRQLQTTSP